MANYRKKIAEIDKCEPWNEKIPGVVYATPKDWVFSGFEKNAPLFNKKKDLPYIFQTPRLDNIIR